MKSIISKYKSITQVNIPKNIYNAKITSLKQHKILKDNEFNLYDSNVITCINDAKSIITC